MTDNPLNLYQEYFVDRDYERLEVFQLFAEQYSIQSALYPGSFVHITPSFVFPVTTYVDMDRQARDFFVFPGLMDFIEQRKIYPQKTEVKFHFADYRNTIEEPDESYDLLISQYAGFVSQHCKRYLKINGFLLVNNSHGDASMAHIDNDFKLTAVILHTDGRYRMGNNNLDAYFVPKKPIDVTKEYLEQLRKGIGYKKTASSYIFTRVK